MMWLVLPTGTRLRLIWMAENVKIISKGDVVGEENWRTAHRMFIHDLLDMREKNTDIDFILKYYSVEYFENGGYTMDLPRLEILKVRGYEIKEKEETMKPKKKGRKGC